MSDCSGLIQIYIYKDAKPCDRIAIDFPLTKEEIAKALLKQERFLLEKMEKLAVKPLIVPRPSEEDCELGYTIVPKWIIDELISRNETIERFVGREGLNAVFEEMQKKGLLEYADAE